MASENPFDLIFPWMITRKLSKPPFRFIYVFTGRGNWQVYPIFLDLCGWVGSRRPLFKY